MALFNQGNNVRIPLLMIFVAATTLAVDADARGGRGGGKSYRSYSSPSYSSSYTQKRSTRTATGVAAAGAVGAAGLALAADDDYYVSANTLNVRSESSSAGRVVRKLKQGDKVHAYEISSDWVRISPENSNPEWVTGQYLSASRP